MNDLIRILNFTKQSTLLEIEESLLQVNDFSHEYYCIKRMNCDSYAAVAKKIFDKLQTLAGE
jgi:TFIIF-interacting CTD phosphatase-like protein